jgi:hypothetical protein
MRGMSGYSSVQPALNPESLGYFRAAHTATVALSLFPLDVTAIGENEPNKALNILCYLLMLSNSPFADDLSQAICVNISNCSRSCMNEEAKCNVF